MALEEKMPEKARSRLYLPNAASVGSQWRSPPYSRRHTTVMKAREHGPGGELAAAATAGIKVLRPQGIGLGGDRGAKAREVASRVRAARALSRAVDLAPMIEELRERGVTTMRAIAAELNRRGIPTPRRQGVWQAGQVSQLLAWLK